MIVLFCYLSDDIHLLFNNCNNLNDLIGAFADNIRQIFYSSLAILNGEVTGEVNVC